MSTARKKLSKKRGKSKSKRLNPFDGSVTSVQSKSGFFKRLFRRFTRKGVEISQAQIPVLDGTIIVESEDPGKLTQAIQNLAPVLHSARFKVYYLDGKRGTPKLLTKVPPKKSREEMEQEMREEMEQRGYGI